MATNTEELTNCIICTATFTDPQVLPCDHTFCKSCVDRLTEAGTIKCPKCKSVCRSGDVRYDFRLNTFLEALAERTEHLTRASRMDVLNKSLPTPATETCEVCETSTVASFCHQCQQWLCTGCRKLHKKQTVSKDHVLTTLAQTSELAKHRMKQELQNLDAAIKNWTEAAAQSALAMGKIDTMLTQANQNSDVMRAAAHEDVDRYFDDVDQKIDSFCKDELKAVVEINSDQHQQFRHLAEVREEIAESLAKSDSQILSTAKAMISKARDLVRLQPDFTVNSAQLSLTRNPSWGINKAVNVKMHSSIEARQRTVVSRKLL